MENAKKVELLLSVFQSSLYTHLMSVAADRNKNEGYLGYIPEYQISKIDEEMLDESKVEFVPNESHYNNSVKEDSQEFPEILLRISKHGKVIRRSSTVKNDLEGFLAPCKGRKKEQTKIEDINIEFEETGRVNTKQFDNKTPKLLQRLMMNESKATPAKLIVPETSHEDSSLPSVYGEVIATTYSQGGDGFVLHPGDFVSILQFLHEFGLVECKWQGMKGLFPQDKIKLITKSSESFNTSISSLVNKQLTNKPLNGDQSSVTSSKLKARLMKKTST